MLDADLYQRVLDELAPALWYLILYFQGEPYLHPKFFELVKQATARKIYTATSTNAHYLTGDNARKTIESGLDRLIISIDGTTQETYESYRIGGKLDRVISGTKEIIAWKEKLKSKTPYLIFQFLVVKPNEHQIPEVQALADKLGVDEVVFKTAQVYDYQKGSPLIPDSQQYSRYRKKPDGSYAIKNKLLNHCWKMWHSCVITWDGQVVPCCFDKDASHPMGDLKTEQFKDLWFNEKYTTFRRSLTRARSEIDICTNCTEGLKVSVNGEGYRLSK
jgi:radical SAM protein with 4Fe4S-binding SPASM domain